MENMVTFLTEMPFWYWWVLATVLLITEIMTGTTYILWPAAAAFLVGFADMGLLNGQWQLQLFLFAGVTMLLTIFATPHAKAWLNKTATDRVNLNERGAQKIGKRVTAIANFENGRGRVRLGDTVWSAEALGDGDIAEGAHLEIAEVKGTVLVVKSVP